MKNPFFERLIASTFWGAPALMLVHDLIILFTGNQYFLPASFAFWLSFYAFIGMAHGMVHLSGNTTFSVVSALLAIFGCLMGITIIGMGRYELGIELEGVSEEIRQAAHANPKVLFTSRVPGITFPIGLILLSIAAWKKQAFSNWILAGLIVSVILFPLGRIPQQIGFNVAGDALMLVFFGRLGRMFFRKG